MLMLTFGIFCLKEMVIYPANDLVHMFEFKVNGYIFKGSNCHVNFISPLEGGQLSKREILDPFWKGYINRASKQEVSTVVYL